MASEMHKEQPQRDVVASSSAADHGSAGRPRISRRQAMGRMSAVATAGAAAWVVPEILMAKPAAGATMSGNPNPGGSTGVSTSPSTAGSPGAGGSAGASGTAGPNGASGSAGVTTAADTGPSGALANTGVDIQRDAEIGAALIAGGWALQHWASRTVKPAAAGISDAHPAESAGDGT